MPRLSSLLPLAVGVALCFSTRAHASPEWRGHVAVEGYGSLLSDVDRSPLLSVNTGWIVRVAATSGNWGGFLHVEENLWRGMEYGSGLVPGALNLGVGGEYRFADGLLRTSMAAGPSVLLFDTQLDEAGRVGVFFEVRPLGLRWELSRSLRLGFDPLSFAVVAPVLSGIPLVRAQYRTGVALEMVLP
ncbi:hypothetical protein AKJ09_02051 [Labilithrix luteola]|uniref:Outer membrane protein beta-barrel domain-containing protein n=1 Tax=Labilithrix luteola TaxID=1391654 RepID=A0A0K1PPE8_9BACT|nr:hypothetical protein [Labilithrix luteola]AKU95387.1 hypothetical protein AKJ09_02051 [Labilithrix luteola]